MRYFAAADFEVALAAEGEEEQTGLPDQLLIVLEALTIVGAGAVTYKR